MTEIDYHFKKGFYINLASHVSLSNNSDVHTMNGLNSFIITPRIETPFIGIYIPVQVNNMTGFDAGAALRFGPLVIGSSNILTALRGSKMLNAYIGVHLMGSKIK